MAHIRVTCSYSDGHVGTWTSEKGATETDRKRRLRDARVKFRSGKGWAELDHSIGELTYVERIEWPDGGDSDVA